jgi:hypothetical protein
MPLPFRNRAMIIEKYPELGQALDDLAGHIENTMTQTNASVNGQSNPPPAPSALSVTASQGIFDAAITDNAPVARGINYFLEYSNNPNFTAPTTVDLGQSRNYRAHLGNQTLYWRAHSSYPTGPRSDHAYHGTQALPSPVIGGGAFTGPAPLASQGSGTSVGASGSDGGFGNDQFRRRIRPTGL